MTGILQLTIMLQISAHLPFDDQARLLQAWTGSEWVEFEDRSQALWSLEWSPVDINRATVAQIAALPGVAEDIARKVVEERHSGGPFTSEGDLALRTEFPASLLQTIGDWVTFGETEPVKERLHIRADRRFGPQADADQESHEGSPVGLTQRYTMSTGRLRFGVLLDKDRYEPSVADLSRFYAAYQGEKASVTAGDFNFTSSQGVTLWTQPVYFDSYDSPASYRRSARGVTSAAQTRENCALRGVAAQTETGRAQIGLFVSRTELDATIDDSLGVQRLSDSGLHRSPGEARKQDSVRETAIGGAVRFAPLSNSGLDLAFTVTGYHAHYAPSFNPAFDSRDRFPLKGDRAGAVGIGGELTARGAGLSGEIGLDREGHTAWMVGINRNGRMGAAGFHFALYHYPPAYHNPRARPPAGGSSAKNRTGAALRISGSPSAGGLVRRLKTHIEVERRPWRSWTIPTPTFSARGSLELTLPPLWRGELTTRYRRSNSQEWRSEPGTLYRVTSDRLRLTWSGEILAALSSRLKLWSEGATRKLGVDRRQYGILAGALIGSSLDWLGTTWLRPRFYLTAVLYSTGGGLPLYQGEAGLPDRVSCVRLSGRGFRWSASAVLRRKSDWFGVKVARTVRRGEVEFHGDTELYVTFSHNFRP